MSGAQEHLHLPDGGLPGWGRDKQLRNQVLARVPGLLSSLLESPITKVCFLARALVADGGSGTLENMRCIKSLPGLSPLQSGGAKLHYALPGQAVPIEQHWRLGLLSFLLSLRREKHRSQEDTNSVEAMLVSLFIM